MSAAEAWGAVMKEVRRCGWPKESEALAALAEKDMLISSLVRSVGWNRICMATPEQLHVEREWFCLMFERGMA